jgi:hypothetical protein
VRTLSGRKQFPSGTGFFIPIPVEMTRKQEEGIDLLRMELRRGTDVRAKETVGSFGW